MDVNRHSDRDPVAVAKSCGDLVKPSSDPSEVRRFQDSQDSPSSLADNEAWLADNSDKMVQARDEVPDEAQDNLQGNVQGNVQGNLAAKKLLDHGAVDEERVLRCLGASVIMQWNTIPAKLQRELFDTAGSMGELLNTAELRGQIARFLHKHKDDPAI